VATAVIAGSRRSHEGSFRTLKRLATLVAVAAPFALALLHAAPSYAGYAVQPSDGLTVTDRNPSFLVYIDDGDTSPEVEVSTSPDHSSYSFLGGYVGSCAPTTPFGEAHKFSCQLPSFETPLAPGTYYWAYEYFKDVCTTTYGFTSCFPQAQFSGPFRFTVAEPVAPPGAGLVSPSAGASVGTMPTLVLHAPAGSGIEIYAADSSARLNDGTPAGLEAFSCSGTADTEADYTCQPQTAYDLTPGETYFWSAVIIVDGTRWVYGPQPFTVRSAPSGGAGGTGASGGAHSISDAALLPRSTHFSGKSVKQTRLSTASYWITKAVGRPKTIAVACWNSTDWPGISGDSGDGFYSIYGFYQPAMPHWIHLAPTVCRGIETLLYHRPLYPNHIIANAVDTVTHEMIHAIGITNEAMTECFAMQVSFVMALRLGVPLRYSQQLGRLTLVNYFTHPARYIDTSRCREGGAWDLAPNEPSPPWHDLALR
jgi:hypothetical protein